MGVGGARGCGLSEREGWGLKMVPREQLESLLEVVQSGCGCY